MSLARRQRQRLDLDRSGGFVGISALACVLFLDVASAGLLRWWAVIGLVVVWLVLFALACRWFVAEPRRVVGLAVLALVLWLLVVVATTVLLG